MTKTIALLLSIFLFVDPANASAKDSAIEAVTEIFFKRNPEAIDKYVVEHYVQHQPGLPNGRAPFKKYLQSLLKASPDYRGEIEIVVAKDDLVSLHVKWEGTHMGEFLGIKPTGKRISRRTADILRIENGRIVEHRGTVDQTEMLVELGLLKRNR